MSPLQFKFMSWINTTTHTCNLKRDRKLMSILISTLKLIHCLSLPWKHVFFAPKMKPIKKPSPICRRFLRPSSPHGSSGSPVDSPSPLRSHVDHLAWFYHDWTWRLPTTRRWWSTAGGNRHELEACQLHGGGGHDEGSTSAWGWSYGQLAALASCRQWYIEALNVVHNAPSTRWPRGRSRRTWPTWTPSGGPPPTATTHSATCGAGAVASAQGERRHGGPENRGHADCDRAVASRRYSCLDWQVLFQSYLLSFPWMYFTYLLESFSVFCVCLNHNSRCVDLETK